jgi:hypothetical protein
VRIELYADEDGSFVELEGVIFLLGVAKKVIYKKNVSPNNPICVFAVETQ